VARVHCLRCDLIERDENKAALREPRVRKFESCLTDAEVTHHQDI
jgi:hypothetical protein